LGADRRALVLAAVLAIAGCAAPVANSRPAPSPKISCLGVPTAKCDEAVASVARSLPNSRPVSIDVSCVSGACTLESGAMDTVVTLDDGSQLRSTTLSWNDGAPDGGGGSVGPAQPVPAAPALPVAPQCVGVPVQSCQSIAQSAANMGGQAVIQIVVTCTKVPCTDKEGEGDMIVTFADGTTNKSSWGYAGS